MLPVLWLRVFTRFTSLDFHRFVRWLVCSFNYFFHSFIKYLWNTSYVPRTVLTQRYSCEQNQHRSLLSWDLIFRSNNRGKTCSASISDNGFCGEKWMDWKVRSVGSWEGGLKWSEQGKPHWANKWVKTWGSWGVSQGRPGRRAFQVEGRARARDRSFLNFRKEYPLEVFWGYSIQSVMGQFGVLRWFSSTTSEVTRAGQVPGAGKGNCWFLEAGLLVRN